MGRRRIYGTSKSSCISAYLLVVLFDTLCVSFSFVIFKFLVFEAAIYANKDVYIVDREKVILSRSQ